MNHLKKIVYCGLFIFSALHSYAQKNKMSTVTINGAALLPADSNRKVHISSLEVSGTKRTKIYIVYREIHFKKGDSLIISDLQKESEQARRQVYNTTLFNEVSFTLNIVDSANVDIRVHVTERWYLYPVPQFQIVDRNFNEWWNTFNHSLNRVNYGIKFVHYNLSGRRDQLRIYLINGYSRNIVFSYSNPYSNSKLTKGFSFSAGYSQSREASYRTSYTDSIQFYSEGPLRSGLSNFVRQVWFVSGSYSIRKGYFTRQNISAAYNYSKVADSVIIKNGNYFKDSVRSMGYPDLAYSYQYTNVDNISYSLKGTTWYFTVLKRGWGLSSGLDMLQFEAGLNKYFSLGKNWYSSVQLSGKLRLPFDQAYLNQRGLGYGEIYLRGLEYNVIDGVALALIKTTLKKKILSFNIPFRLFPRVLTRIPITLFAKVYNDYGYVYNKPKFDTYLTDRLLYTGGFGIDLLTLYDINLRFEYSFNQLNRNGLFFHTQSGF